MDLRLFKRIVSSVTLMAFILLSVSPSSAQVAMIMPPAGQLVSLSAKESGAQMIGIKVDPKDPFQFNFIIDRGDKQLAGDARQAEYQKLLKYFLVALTMPNTDMWVNLSPYEADRIIPDNFAQTAMGRDLLAQDYLLKQITS